MPLCGGKLTLTEVISGPPGLDDTGFVGCSAVMVGATAASGVICVSAASSGQQESNRTARTLSGCISLLGMAYLPIVNRLNNISDVPKARLKPCGHGGRHPHRRIDPGELYQKIRPRPITSAGVSGRQDPLA